MATVLVIAFISPYIYQFATLTNYKSLISLCLHQTLLCFIGVGWELPEPHQGGDGEQQQHRHDELDGDAVPSCQGHYFVEHEREAVELLHHCEGLGVASEGSRADDHITRDHKIFDNSEVEASEE